MATTTNGINTGRRGKPGISKATGYRAEIFNIVYDVRGGCQAYGFDFMRWLVNKLEDGLEYTTISDVLDQWHEYQLEQAMEE